jgi:hypothetical protein
LQADSIVQYPNQDRPHEFSAQCCSILTTLSKIPLVRDDS